MGRMQSSGKIYSHEAGEDMTCPHCGVTVHARTLPVRELTMKEDGKDWGLQEMLCTRCKHTTIRLVPRDGYTLDENQRYEWIYLRDGAITMWPRSRYRPECPPEVPADYANDYSEAQLIIAESPKSAATLGRRSLQLLAVREAGANANDNMFNQIDHMLQLQGAQALPADVAETLHTLRQSGNLAAHPHVDLANQIIDVEPEEAELTLVTVALLFDHYFVSRIKRQSLIEQVNQKYKTRQKP
jgi:Domain of unknown function (DUF4145)